MKQRIALLSLLALCLSAAPAMAQALYDNGPINGTTDAWIINFGSAVSDSFRTSGGTISGLSFGAWLAPGDVPSFVEVLIGTSEFDGSLFDGFVNLTQSNCVVNQYGYNVCTESATFNGPTLAAGSYWLTLENAQVKTNEPMFWDENSGPSDAVQNSVGTIPSEAFTLMGTASTCLSTPCGPPSVAEPSTMLLFTSGVLGLFGLLGRRLF